MKEYIEREATLKCLKNSLSFCENKLELGEFRRGCIAATEDDIRNIVRIPAADVIEVVRCKDCQYYESTPYGKLVCKCWMDWLHTEPDDFCSSGCKKDN